MRISDWSSDVCSSDLFNGYTASTIAGGVGQLTFAFKVSPDVLWTGLKWALAIGFVGGLFPALRAATQPVTKALRDARWTAIRPRFPTPGSKRCCTNCSGARSTSTRTRRWAPRRIQRRRRWRNRRTKSTGRRGGGEEGGNQGGARGA